MATIHITITGNLGSGKSTLCRQLSEHYGFTKYSTGDVQRKLAAEMGMTTLELNLFMQSDPKYDNLIDDEVIRIAMERYEDNLIFDSRMAWHFVPISYKVFLIVDAFVAAERIFSDDRRGQVERYASLAEAMLKLRERATSERERFHAFYGADYFNLKNYDLVIDTSEALPETISAVIISEAKHYFADSSTAHALISPRSIYPAAQALIQRYRASELRHGSLHQEPSQPSQNSSSLYADIDLKLVHYAGCFYLAEPERTSELIDHILNGTPYITATINDTLTGPFPNPDLPPPLEIAGLTLKDIHNLERSANFSYRRYPEHLLT